MSKDLDTKIFETKDLWRGGLRLGEPSRLWRSWQSLAVEGKVGCHRVGLWKNMEAQSLYIPCFLRWWRSLGETIRIRASLHRLLKKLLFGADFGKGTTSVVPSGPLKSIALQRLRVALCRECKKLTSGAKARTQFQRLSGTSELVPFPKTTRREFFGKPLKSVP
jgi:hypothetical protein